MEDLKKVSSEQLYKFLKNLSVGLLSIVAMIAFSRLLPFYLSPVVSLVCAAAVYTILYNNKVNNRVGCMLVPYTIFFCFISYSFVIIILNILFAWGIVYLPREFIFFNDPYVPALLLNPICLVVIAIMYSRRSNIFICQDCKMQTGDIRGKLGNILNHESYFQMRNLMWLFGSLSVVMWTYYEVLYINIDINDRDWYVFMWLEIIAFLLDEIYFIFRYYNLYLDLKENDEIITPEELSDMTAKTYVRYYVICGNYMYMTVNSMNPETPYRKVIDTPFFTKRIVNGITFDEDRQLIVNMTGVKTGELKFFYGRKLKDLDRHSLLRYFYFFDGDIKDYPDLRVDGEWMNFDEIKKIYSHNPGKMSQITVADITRLATIMLTEKTFDEHGFRKSRLRQYKPTFNLREVRDSDLDFQDDKWIKISMFNSDTRLYRLKKWWRRHAGSNKGESSQWE